MTDTKQLFREFLQAAAREGIDLRQLIADEVSEADPGDWVCKGVRFPAGTFFRTWYRDRPYWGVVRDGRLFIDDQPFATPSEAAEHVTGKSISGWNFWEARAPGAKRWDVIADLRPGAQPRRRRAGRGYVAP